MSTALKRFLAQLLARHGALVEDIGEDSLEVLFPAALAEQLGVGELERFSFPDVSPGNTSSPPISGSESPSTRVVSYQSEMLDTLGGLMVGHGAVAAAALAEPLPVKRLAVERDIERAITLQNAVFRAHQQEPATVPYLIVHFKYAALSDEQREGMVSLAVNERTLNVVEGLSELVPHLPLTTPPDNAGRAAFEPAYARAHRAAQRLIQDGLADFIKSINRRFNRDCQRVTEYYRTMQQEIEVKIQKKHLTGEEQEREESRIRATGIELDRKIRDLQAKYDLTVRVEVVGVLRLFLPVMLVSLTVMRRKWMVRVELAWNPLLRELERVVCVGCVRPSRRIFICDEQRHTVCPDCFTLCSTCQHPCCRACTPRGCPRCRKGT